MIDVLVFIGISPLLLALLYVPAIQIERGGFWKIFYLVAIPALIIDVIANTFVLSLIYRDLPFQYSEFLHRREFTFSDRLERFVLFETRLGKISRFISKLLNRFAPSGVHIKNLQNYRG